jgi:hypothetical protein
MAERAFISRNTLGKVEKRDPGVSLGIYATVLFVLGLIEPSRSFTRLFQGRDLRTKNGDLHHGDESTVKSEPGLRRVSTSNRRWLRQRPVMA